MASIDATASKQTHIAIIPNPGAGHLISLAEFARHLLLHNPSLFFTFILIPSTADANTSAPTTPPALSSLPATAFDIINLPPPSFPAFSDFNDEVFSRIMLSISRSLPLLRQTLQQISHELPVAALIVDIFATDIIHVGSDLGIKSYIFFSASGICLSMFLHLPKDIESSDVWGPDDQEPLTFPGCPTVRVKDLPDPLLHRTTVYPKLFIDHCKRFESCEAIILNSFQPLEDGPIRALTKTAPPVHVVGPIVRAGSRTEPSGCLRWLDEQPLGSVLYVSFGSGGTLSTKQVTELAWGLELSQQRFLWVVRRPNDSVSYGAFLGLEESSPLGFLPKGFVERTEGRGLVVHSWSPQVEVLSHKATGGFLTHCGWNSVLEGVANGVGLIAWPLYAEQKMNAIELVEEVKVALRVKKNDEGVAEREDIAEVVKALMEGKEGDEIKQRMKKLKDEARRRMGKDGESSVTLSRLVHMWNI